MFGKVFGWLYAPRWDVAIEEWKRLSEQFLED